MSPYIIALLVWLGVISLIAAITTVYDKYAAKKRPRNRVPEKTLLFIAALGGSVVMLAVMLLIRHKTKHMKFMLGIPVIIALQLAAAIAVCVLL